ncbi:MAG: sortase [Anaerolineales bacterium]|jgi:LPXTG-site transpeptidase (sortase) family protein|nr:sortase [Anaerolineales bacterium]MDP7644376.1 sortase [Anaerolineales bacterium]HJN41376.1 sortase [Anaerolineales bacterium]|tara:strand:- start:422 stop:1411 length:990 start_codon:yes stop_codon:yes gene_type:complete
MNKRKYNPVRQSLGWLLAGFLFSACGSPEPDKLPAPVGQGELALPEVAVVTQTPRANALVTGTFDTGADGKETRAGTPVAASEEPVAVPTATQELVLYEVQSGDWLAKIARQFGVALQALMEANPDVNPQYLQPGALLVLPLTGTPPPQAEPEEVDAAQESGFAPVPAELAGLAQQVFGGALPQHVSIPVIGIEVDVVAVGWHTEKTVSGKRVLWHSPGEAAGFLVSSAAPGAGGNAVFYGHHNVQGSVFRGLDRLQPGDAVSMRNAAGTLDYVVERVDVFEENSLTASQKLVHMQYFAPTASEQLTLLTCWPFTGNSHRVAVVAKPTE